MAYIMATTVCAFMQSATTHKKEDTMTIEQIEAKIEMLERGAQQDLANFHAKKGAIQALQDVKKDLLKEKESENESQSN